MIEDRMRTRRTELSSAIAEAERHLAEAEQVLAPQREACATVLARLRALSGRAAQLTGVEASVPQPALPA
jgi:ABC-type transporter Mla subunit MlaD